GTQNHLLLMYLSALKDATVKHITGLEAETVLGQAGITVNKNTIPSEKLSPFVTSGLRIGTPAVTSRGMKEDDMEKIALWISRVLKDVAKDRSSKTEINAVKKEVTEFAAKFPLYPEVN
ncbi:MAG: serine hydroxymethyltransferase, partial [Methanomicrobium sp.]|nr:serine hydroxymethyltransferase [Methanomicrobium sp.]